MGAQFANVVAMIVSAEGSKDVDSPSDYGGETKYGISKREYPDLDIASLSESQAMGILETDYWNKYHLSQIENQAIANQIFFLLVNMNPEHAITIVQISINVCGRGMIRASVDGVLGAETIQALNSLADNWLSNRIRLETIRYYLHLTDDDKSQIPNFRGWVRRALNQ